MIEHDFTPIIRQILAEHYGVGSDEIFERSYLLQYLNIKTRSASKGSKARSSFGNLYAIYVVVEDYLNKGFLGSSEYSEYDGAKFSDLLRRQRELPFGTKLQNHALNHRLNEEFRKYFPTCEYSPLLRNVETNRYWVNERLLVVQTSPDVTTNIAPAIIEVVNAYIKTKRQSLDVFLRNCEAMITLQHKAPEEVQHFVYELLRPNVDARLFEIVSFAILKASYSRESIYWGWSWDEVQENALTLFKTGRTNANDGGIDFVMRPLGRFFQVTETMDVRKYFLDIEKIQRYPITFVVKSDEPVDVLWDAMRALAIKHFGVSRIVDTYMDSIEELINIPTLVERFSTAVTRGDLQNIMEELVRQSKLEFNYAPDGSFPAVE